MSEDYIAATCNALGPMDYVVYVLRSQTDPNLMYCGMTNNIRRRLRQHNGHIKGGGEYTSSNRPWHLAALIPIGNDSPASKTKALQVEYWTKAKNYPAEMQNQIPNDCPVKRRVWLIRESMRRHQCSVIFWFDQQFHSVYNTE